MSTEDENLRVIRGIYDAVARRDASAAFAVYHEDILWDFSATARSALMRQPVSRGHDGVRQAWQDALAAFGAMDYEILEMQAAGERVLVTVRDLMSGRASGLSVQAIHYAVWTLSAGVVTRLEVFDDRGAAELAAGL